MSISDFSEKPSITLSPSLSSSIDEAVGGIYDMSDMTVPMIPRIFTPDNQFFEFNEPNSGWCHMHIGSIDIPTVSYLTDPLFDAMEMLENVFNHDDGSMQIDHEGDTTEIEMSGISDSMSGRSVKIKITTGCGEREIMNIVTYDAVLVSIYGLIASLADNLAAWSEWSMPDTDDDKADATDGYMDAAKRMIDAASKQLDIQSDNGEYDSESGKHRYEYVKGAIDMSHELLASISASVN